MDTQDRSMRAFRPGAVAGGLILLALGLGLLVDGTGLLRLHSVIAPFVLIVLGAVISLERGAFVCTVPAKDDDGNVRFQPRQRGPGGGFWLIGIGVWMLISQNHLWGFRFETSWPLLVVFMGIMTVARGWR